MTSPGPVAALTVGTRTDQSITLSWTNPTDPDITKVVVRRTTGTNAPAGPDKGDPVTLPTPTSESVVDSGLNPATHYSYAIFTQDNAGNTSDAVTITTATRDTTVDLCARGITTDTTWSPDYRDVYLITCNLTIPTGITFTISPERS